MKLYVLTLASAIERQENISSQLESAGIEFEFFFGVDGRNKPHQLFEKYDESKRMKTKGEAMLPGQLGCFASHYILWEKCIDDGVPCIILEDDARIDTKKLISFISVARFLNDHFECVRLFRNKSRVRKAFPVDKIGEFLICKFFKGHMSTTGYYLTPSGAKKFLASAQKWHLPVDIYMDQFWVNRVECYGIEPPCITNDESMESFIQYIPKTRKMRRSLIVKLNRESYLLKNNIYRWLWNMKYLFTNPCKSKRTSFIM